MARKGMDPAEIIQIMKKSAVDGCVRRKQIGSTVYYNAVKKFGSWVEACEKAGVKPGSGKYRYQNKQDVINAIREITEKNQEIPGSYDNYSLKKAVERHFGSWEAGIKAAGFCYRGKRKPSKTLKKEDRELLNMEPVGILKKSVERTIPAKCQKCYWRDGAICPFIECVKEREEEIR